MKKLSVILTLILIIFVGYYVYNEYLKKVETNPYENTLRDYSNQVLSTIKNNNYLLETTKIDTDWLNSKLDSLVSCQEIYYSNENKILLHKCSINDIGSYYFYDKIYDQNTDEYNNLYETIKNQKIEIEKGILLKDLATIDLNMNITEIDNCVNEGICEPGTPLLIQVNDVDIYKFYVLKDDGEKVKLIMAENLVNNIVYAPSDNLEGPTEALTYLKNETENWTNLEERTIKISDENKDKAYTDIYEKLRATLPSYNDVYNFKDKNYLYDNLSNSSGYWLSTATSKSFYAWSVVKNDIKITDVSIETLGIRPVIEVYKY